MDVINYSCNQLTGFSSPVHLEGLAVSVFFGAVESCSLLLI